MKTIQSITSHGEKCWVLGNDQITMHLTETGGHMAPVYFGESAIQPYFLNPWSTEGTDIADELVRLLRGDFFCLPFGNLNSWNGESHPNHGQSATALWTLKDSLAVKGFRVSQFAMDSTVRSGSIEKNIGFKDGEPILYLQDVVVGFSGPSSYGHHATLKFPEGNNRLFVSTSPFRFGMVAPRKDEATSNGLEYYSLKSGAVFHDLSKVPTIWKDPSIADCTHFPSQRGFGDTFAVFHRPEEVFAWTCAAYPDDGYLWFSLKEPSVLPGMLMWIENRSRQNHPWNGRVSCIGLIDMCGNFAFGLGDSIQQNVLNDYGVRTIHNFGNEIFRLQTIQGVVSIPSSFGRVEKVEAIEGECVFRSENGQSVSCNVDIGFLHKGFQ